MICWTCYWGWPVPVLEVYWRALSALWDVGADDMALKFSFAHIVWEDHNFDDSCIRFCMSQSGESDFQDVPEDERAIVLQSLRELMKIPEDGRCFEPEEYDGKTPALFPPQGATAISFGRWR